MAPHDNTPILYLSSRIEWKRGTILRGPIGDRYPRGAAVENLIDKVRPDSSLSRMRSIFLFDSPNSVPNRQFVYEVTPIGNVGKGHIGWVDMIDQHQWADWIALQDWVDQYWREEVCPCRGGDWEYRAGRVKIVKAV